MLLFQSRTYTPEPNTSISFYVVGKLQIQTQIESVFTAASNTMSKAEREAIVRGVSRVQAGGDRVRRVGDVLWIPAKWETSRDKNKLREELLSSFKSQIKIRKRTKSTLEERVELLDKLIPLFDPFDLTTLPKGATPYTLDQTLAIWHKAGLEFESFVIGKKIVPYQAAYVRFVNQAAAMIKDIEHTFGECSSDERIMMALYIVHRYFIYNGGTCMLGEGIYARSMDCDTSAYAVSDIMRKLNDRQERKYAYIVGGVHALLKSGNKYYATSPQRYKPVDSWKEFVKTFQVYTPDQYKEKYGWNTVEMRELFWRSAHPLIIPIEKGYFKLIEPGLERIVNWFARK